MRPRFGVPGGGRVSEGLVQAGVDGDQAVEGGEGEDAADLGAGDHQPDLPAFGLDSFVRAVQDVQPGAVAESGPGHVDHEGRAGAGGGAEQGCPQLVGVGDIDLLRRHHDGHAADDLNGEPRLSQRHRRHLRAGPERAQATGWPGRPGSRGRLGGPRPGPGWPAALMAVIRIRGRDAPANARRGSPPGSPAACRRPSGSAR
jgi:hypothetical protein